MAIVRKWPRSSDYLEAVQAPEASFTVPQLRSAVIRVDQLGIPSAATGKSAIVFRATVGSQDVALRCFTREASHQESRYRALRAHLDGNWPRYLVDFTYRDHEILVGARRYPVVEMSWAEGQTLNAWIGQHLRQDRELVSLAMRWLEVVKDLEGRGIAHGDIDSDNFLVSGFDLTLIDYDGVFVPALSDAPPGEAGIPDFQHPGRPGYYAPNMDAFPALVIYLSLLALESDRSLWQRYHSGENLIFSASDYAAPQGTRIWQDLAGNRDPGVRRLTAALADMCDAHIDSLPPLSQIVGRTILPMREPGGTEVPGSYDAEINRQNPGCLLLLVDQSGSMNDAFAGSLATRKADAVADAINNVLMEIVIRCTQSLGEGPRNYFDVGVIGYGSKDGVGSCLGAALRGRVLVSVSELAENTLRVEKRPKRVSDGAGGVVETAIRFPVWLDPVAEGGAPMREAIQLAGTLLDSWVAEHPTSRPPIVVNISGGGADTDPVAAAEKLTSIRTSDGTVLLYNVYLSSSAIPAISFPGSLQELPDFPARALFGMSTIIPRHMRDELALEGYVVESDARGFVLNADFVPIIEFLDLGTRLTLGDEIFPFTDEQASPPSDASREPGGTKATLFISYSHRDERYREQLVKHLASLIWQGAITDWYDRKVVPGKEWRDEIDQNLDTADCVLLLVSPDFLASEYCYSIEMQRALEKHREGRVLVIPVIVRSADWRHTPLGDLEALPKDAKPVVEWVHRDRAWLNVTEGIRRALWPANDAPGRRRP
jgi:hypothetical protein